MRYPTHDTEVALKRERKVEPNDSSFLRELRVLTSISHRNIVGFVGKQPHYNQVILFMY